MQECQFQKSRMLIHQLFILLERARGEGWWSGEGCSFGVCVVLESDLDAVGQPGEEDVVAGRDVEEGDGAGLTKPPNTGRQASRFGGFVRLVGAPKQDSQIRMPARPAA